MYTRALASACDILCEQFLEGGGDGCNIRHVCQTQTPKEIKMYTRVQLQCRQKKGYENDLNYGYVPYRWCTLMTLIETSQACPAPACS